MWLLHPGGTEPVAKSATIPHDASVHCKPPVYPVYLLQIDVRARDVYGNAVDTGDPGFILLSSLTDYAVPGSVTRTIISDSTLFSLRIQQAGLYTLRVEDAQGMSPNMAKLIDSLAGWEPTWWTLKLHVLLVTLSAKTLCCR
jgi:hypothetical protein